MYFNGQLVDNIKFFIYLVTYVNIVFVCCPKRNWISMFRILCKKKYINLTKYENYIFTYETFTYPGQPNEYINSKSNNSIAKTSGNIIVYGLYSRNLFQTRHHPMDKNSLIKSCVYFQQYLFPCSLKNNVQNGINLLIDKETTTGAYWMHWKKSFHSMLV